MRYRVLSSSPLLRSTSQRRAFSQRSAPSMAKWLDWSEQSGYSGGRPSKAQALHMAQKAQELVFASGFWTEQTVQQTAFRVHDFLGGHSGAILWGLQLGSSLSVPVIQISPVVSFVIIIAGIVVFWGTKAPRVYSAKHQTPSECSE